ncbi:MAG: TonB family protein [Gammaproteobacteria bacterium]|jgi:protein TonB
MDWAAAPWLIVRDFFERGGTVLLALTLIIFAMWTVVLSQWLYLRKEYRSDIAPYLARWLSWRDKESPFATALKAQFLAAAEYRLHSGLALVRTLATVCPLLGLLGTVVGMIIVFHMMGAAGANSPRVVAAGVSTAMVTTMAGMVGALSGIFPAAMLARRARSHLKDLRFGDGARQVVDSAHPNAGSMRTIRYVAAPVGALLITLALAFGMEQMIRVGRNVMTDTIAGVSVDYVRVERAQSVARRERKPDKPTEVALQPDVAPQPVADGSSRSGIAIAVAPPRADFDMRGLFPKVGTGMSAVTDGEYLPIVKVAPIYPRRAAMMRLEGYVIVQFTVTANGSVRDVAVVESSNEVFNQAAVDAALRFRYRPRVINGEAVEVAGVLNRITFVLDQSA